MYNLSDSVIQKVLELEPNFQNYLSKLYVAECGSAGFARAALALELVTRFYTFGGQSASDEAGGADIQPMYWPFTGAPSSSDSALLVRLTHLLAPASQLAVADAAQPASKPIAITAAHAPLTLLRAHNRGVASSVFKSGSSLELVAREWGNFVLKVSCCFAAAL